MKFWVCAAVSLCGIAASAHAQESPMAARSEAAQIFTSQDVFALEYADSPRISPDGRQVLYTRRSNDIMTDRTRGALWLAALDGSSNRLLQADASGGEWSPSGDRIAFTDTDEEGRAAIFIRWMDSGQVERVAAMPSGIASLAWSPDGQWLAFTSRVAADAAPLAKAPKKPAGAKWAEPFKFIDHARYRRDGQGFIDVTFSHVFVVPASGGTPRQLTTGDFDHSGPLAWTRGGRSVLTSSNRHEGWELETVEADIWEVGATNAFMRQVTATGGSESAPVLAPDGSSVAFVCQPNVKRPVWQVDVCVAPLGGGAVRNLTESLDREVSDVRWAGRHIYFSYDDQGLRKVARVSPSGGAIETLLEGLGGTSLGRPYLSGTYDVSASGALAWTQGRHDRPADIFAQSGNRTRQLTQLNEDLLAHRQLGKVHRITYASAHDGAPIEGWYITPPNFDPQKKYPLVLEIHGGPHLSYGPHFSAEMQRYAAEGYVVFYDNHRGSTGYGEAFGLLLEGKYSSPDDAADHLSGVDAMIAKGFIDEDNLFVTGGSAGGIATAYLIGLTDRFNAAVAAKPIINWLSKPLSADSYISQLRHQFPALPWEDPMHYWQRSPLSLVGNVTTPTMLMTGELDQRTPISESEQFYQALKLRGIDTALVRVPGSYHGIASRPSRLIAKVDNILAWFARYKTPRAAPEGQPQ